MHYETDKLEDYASSLARVASLSNLFSESKTPYLHYRTTEYLYSRIFSAKNLARSDIAIDAALGNIGVGIKTFVYFGRPKFEKIAEFNKENDTYSGLADIDMVIRISQLRNSRIDIAGKIADVNEFIYHCIARLPGKLYVFEDVMPYITIANIEITKKTKTTISFTDGISKYRFNISKSTLFKEFFAEKSLFEKPVVILDDPFDLINSIELHDIKTIYETETILDEQREYIVLPLYSIRDGKKYVYEHSGLNQWNGERGPGQPRNKNELYIPIPVKIRELYSDFLPDRNSPFELYFPAGQVFSVKVSQADGKALMSQRNADLGKWLLRDILGIKEGELVTYDLLESIGIDSVEISKVNDKYYIDFKKLGSYEEFLGEES